MRRGARRRPGRGAGRGGRSGLEGQRRRAGSLLTNLGPRVQGGRGQSVAERVKCGLASKKLGHLAGSTVMST